MDAIAVVLKSSFTKDEMFRFIEEKGGYAVREIEPDRGTIEVDGGALFLDYFDEPTDWEDEELEALKRQLGQEDLVEVVFSFRYSNPSYRLAFTLADEMVERWEGVLDADDMPREA